MRHDVRHDVRHNVRHDAYSTYLTGNITEG